MQSVKFLKNGLLTSGSLDRTIKLWEMNAYRTIASTNAHSKGINSLTILSNGYIATSSMDQTVKIWDTNLYLNISKLN